MSETKTIPVEAREWRLMLTDLGLKPQDLLRRAGLPHDLFSQPDARLSTQEYFKLLDALEAASGDPALGFKIGTATRSDAFHPLIFAVSCSPNLEVALKRLATYKRLILPIEMVVETDAERCTVFWFWADRTLQVPTVAIATELMFKVRMARDGTRTRIVPLEVVTPQPLAPADLYEAYLGVSPVLGTQTSITFSREDAARPFLTASQALWDAFEPSLRYDLGKLEAQTPLPEKVRNVLFETLPSGAFQLEQVARRLGMSGRTLQRQLREGGTQYRDIVKRTRLDLAVHYIRTTTLSYDEIAFLLGFEKTSSLFRAIRRDMGTTPEAMRQRANTAAD